MTRRISISLNDEQYNWLKDNKWVSPTGLFKQCLSNFRASREFRMELMKNVED